MKPATAAAQGPPAGAEAEAPRPRIGLVLGGGGARGAAHIGVLEVLERLRVPVDCVAGTGMGALVAGAWASGLDAADMRRELGRADWNDMYHDNPDYADLNYRNKQLSRCFLPGSETGIRGLQTMAPAGVVSGLMAPLDYRGRKLGDGGLLSIAEQAIALLTEQNVQASRALLRPADVYIEPDLDGITAGDFASHAAATDRGRVAAAVLAPRPQALALVEAAYARWRKRMAVGERAAPTVDEVQIAGLGRVNPAVVQRYASLRPGDPLDTTVLNRDLLRVYGDGWYQSVDYGLARCRRPQRAAAAAGGKALGAGLRAPGRAPGVPPEPGHTFELRGATGPGSTRRAASCWPPPRWAAAPGRAWNCTRR